MRSERASGTLWTVAERNAAGILRRVTRVTVATPERTKTRSRDFGHHALAKT